MNCQTLEGNRDLEECGDHAEHVGRHPKPCETFGESQHYEHQGIPSFHKIPSCQKIDVDI
jgi:hypothetical protein